MDARKKRDVDMSEFFNFVSKAQPQQSDDEDHNALPISDSNDDTGEDINYIYGDQDEDYLNENEEGKVMGDTQQDDDEQPSYDPESDLPDFDAQGTYSLELVGQRQLLSRQRRGAVNHLQLPEATQSTLLAHVDHGQLLHLDRYLHSYPVLSYTEENARKTHFYNALILINCHFSLGSLQEKI